MLLAAMLISRAFRVETLTLEGGAGVLGARMEEELDCRCPTLSRSLRRVGVAAECFKLPRRFQERGAMNQ
jgi:hypothetical protein